MKDKKHDETRRSHAFIRTSGAMLALFMLVSIAVGAPFAYITNQDSNTVSIIDTALENVTATVDVGDGPVGIAVTPDGTKVYVTNCWEGTVSVIDTATNIVTATVEVGSMPFGVVVTPDGEKAYVTNWGSNDVSVIDIEADNVTATFPVGIWPEGFVVTPDGTRGYVANAGSDTVSVINMSTNTVVATVDVGDMPQGIAVKPDGKKVYVTNGGSHNVSVIDTATNTATATVDVGEFPQGFAVTPDGTRGYVANDGSNTVSVIDTATNNVSATVEVESMPFGVSITPDGTKVYVVNGGNGTVSIIDTATNNVTATVTVGNGARAFGQFIGPVSAPEPPVPYEINITRITTNGSANLPDIHGNNIVWQDGNYSFANLSVYNLSTHREIKITTNSSEIPRAPKIYEDRIIWIDSSNESHEKYGNNSTFDIYMYNLSTSKKTKITTSGSVAWTTSPAIYGNRIVWIESHNGSRNIYMYNISTQKETQITKNGWPLRSAIYGDKIVWEQGNSTISNNAPGRPNDAYMYNLSTNKTTKIITSKTDYYRVAIYGDKIAYQSGGIHVYNLSTGKDTRITNKSKAQYPDIYEDRIVWEDWRNENADIYLYNTSTSEETQVTTDNSDQKYPAIYGDKIVWEDRKDIYIGTLEKKQEPEPVSQWEFSPLNPVSGDTLNINGTASPEEKVNVSVTFEKNVPVSDGRFEYILENVTIPEGRDNLFTVEAMGANNLNVRVKMIIWVTKSSEASEGTATVSQSNVPPGTYKIRIDGDAGEGVSEIDLKITASQGIQSDPNGNFSYFYNTAAVPPGNFEVKVGDITKEITIKPEDTEQPLFVLPVANFSSNVTMGNVPLSVQFTDLSTNATSWNWDFGDGTTSTSQDPVHEYWKEGKYTVSLKVDNEVGSDTKKISKYIIVKN